MKKKSLNIHYLCFHTPDELDDKANALIEAAHHAMKKAYSPYSEFQVGAALMLDDGSIVEGNNQENAAYPSGLCAERVALFYAGAQYPDKKVISIAVMANNLKVQGFSEIVSPCGACRQVMVETQSRQNTGVRVILASINGSGIIFENVDGLMPFAFDLKSLLTHS
jgi:cytidine deaminase